MENFNKVMSFVLGLIVVIVFFALLTGRLNFKDKISTLSKSSSPKITLTPTPISRVRISPTPISSNKDQNIYQKKPSNIPSTGSPTIILPLMFSSLMIGFYLRKKVE